MSDSIDHAETVTDCHEAPDVAELRRLAENATPGPWVHEWVDGDDWWSVYGCPTGDMVCPEVCTMWGSDEAAYIAAANPAATLGLLDRLAHMREARDAARAEVKRLTAKVERVRALADEWTYNGEFGWDDGSHVYGPDCEGQALDYAAAKLRRALDEEPQP